MRHLRRAHHTSFHFVLCFGILDGEFGAFRNAVRKNQHGSAGADGMRGAFDRLRLAIH